MKSLLSLVVVGVLLSGFSARAEDLRDIKALLKKNENLLCSMVIETSRSSEDGRYEEEEPTVVFSNLTPKASSASDLATYALEFETAGYYFRYFMNSQIGAMEVLDKATQFESRMSLVIHDMDKRVSRTVGDMNLTQYSKNLIAETSGVKTAWKVQRTMHAFCELKK